MNKRGREIMEKEQGKVMEDRFKKLEEVQRLGIEAYPNRLKRPERIKAILLTYGEHSQDALRSVKEEFLVAGRIMGLRRFGKAAFFHIKDESGRIQVHVRRDVLGQEAFAIFRKMDIGDIVQVKGALFRTKTGELTISADKLTLVTKNLRPLPEKYHGLRDKELRYRQRYLDLIVNEDVKDTFRKRAKIIQVVRHYFQSNGFLEVETPMMQPIVGGATARPFVTHHNALGIDLYLRIAPELYLKRLLVGGFERVFELNRNFRNEGISIQHNPEFTMLEFYEAYATFEDLMVRTEELFSLVSNELYGKTTIQYQGNLIDLTPPWRRLTLRHALMEIGGIPEGELDDREAILGHLEDLGVSKGQEEPLGKLWTKLFDVLVEPRLIQPTFITHYPLDVSPLARRNQDDPSVTDRFELFVAGREIANAFSELNDPRDQQARFEEQVKNRGGDEEIPPEVDYDYIRALQVGMPPAAGEGVGIDRLVMLFTDSPSIRDVILFPQLRPEHT